MFLRLINSKCFKIIYKIKNIHRIFNNFADASAAQIDWVENEDKDTNMKHPLRNSFSTSPSSLAVKIGSFPIGVLIRTGLYDKDRMASLVLKYPINIKTD